MNRTILYILFLSISYISVSQNIKEIELRADLGGGAKPLLKYWKSTGFSPADLLDYPDMEMTLDYLKASGGIEYIRPHYLLDHVRIKDFATQNQVIDWSGLDSKLDKIVNAGLKLIFEIMGNPADREIDYADETDLFAWKDFVRDLALHYTERYGRGTVESWYFETSNEPDLQHFWSHGMVKFLNYYDACSEGLLQANPGIRFGGPGTALGASPTFKLLMEHCSFGKNWFTGEKGVRIDFISTHRKNIPHRMITDELKVWNYLEDEFPELIENVPIMNDEADPIAGWGIPYYWRTGPWYAAFIVQSVELHNRLILDSIPGHYILLSNDHGFLGSWGKRTQLARFIPGDNQQTTRGASRWGGSREVSIEEDTRPPVESFYLVKKPSLTGLSLMNLFGEQRFDVTGISDLSFPNAGAIVTLNSSGDVISALYNKPEMDLSENNMKPTMVAPADQKELLTGQGVDIHLQIEGLRPGEYKLVQYRFDDIHSHAYQNWLEMGSPEDPSISQYRLLSAAMEPEIVELKDIRVDQSPVALRAVFPSSGVSFFIIAAKGEGPGPVTGLDYNLYKGLNGEDMVMLTWDRTSERCIKSYEVYARGPGESKYSKVNPSNLLDTGFAHNTAHAAGFRYKVRLVDYWDRAGKFSGELHIEQKRGQTLKN